MNTLQNTTTPTNIKQQKRLTIDELFEKFIENCRLKNTTIIHYRSRYYNHIKPPIGDMLVDDIAEADVIRLMEAIIKRETVEMVKTPSPGAPVKGGIDVAKACLTPLKKILDYGISIGAVKENVARKAKIAGNNKIFSVREKKKANSAKKAGYHIVAPDTSPSSLLIYKMDELIENITTDTTSNEVKPKKPITSPPISKQQFSIADTSPYMPEIEKIDNIGREIREFANNKGMNIVNIKGKNCIIRSDFLEIAKQKFGITYAVSTMRSKDCRGEGPADAVKRGGRVWYSLDSLASWLYEIMEKDE